MSRRIRTKMKRSPFHMGLNHHKQYSQTTTSFPHSYSIMGTPISMPFKIMPLFKNGNLNLICDQENLNFELQKILERKDEQQQTKQANISISGQIKRMNNKAITTSIFILSMCCCCLFKLFKISLIRNLFYTKYSMDLRSYQQIGTIISNLKNCCHFIINIQDNQLDKHKLYQLLNGLQYNESQKKVYIIIRNYCYCINDTKSREYRECFQRLQNQNIQYAFVWQNLILKSQGINEKKKNQQQQTLVQSVLNC